jgi:hypothetical protein
LMKCKMPKKSSGSPTSSRKMSSNFELDVLRKENTMQEEPLECVAFIT